MPASTKKRPPMEAEYGEGKAHEQKESPEEEVREGAEPDDTPKAKTNRKRSAKGAKRTKAPMDSDCGCGGKKGTECDGNCGGYAKKDRNDALTPQEYLAACDLGIQNRSRAYIRARLDAAERLDLKCGKGSISEGEKCTKGTAQRAEPGKKRGGIRNALENAAIIGGMAGTAVSYGQVVRHALSGNMSGASKALQREGAFAALTGAGVTAKGVRTNNKLLKQEGAKALAAGGVAIGAGHLIGGGYTKGIGASLPSASSVRQTLKRGASNLAGRASAAKSNVTYRTAKSQFKRMYNSPGRRDSVYASGFSPDLAQLAI